MRHDLKFIAIFCIALILIAGLFVFLESTEPVERINPSRYLRIEDLLIRVEIAHTAEARAQGLSGTTALNAGEGMLFVFDSDGQHAFWMKDMLIPIDIIWADVNGSVIHIEHALSPETYPQSFMPPLPARYVLEVPAGFALEHGIGVGSKLEFSL